MINWEYLLVTLPSFDPPQTDQGASVAVPVLGNEGLQGWEAVGITMLAHGKSAVLMKRPIKESRQAGGRL